VSDSAEGWLEGRALIEHPLGRATIAVINERGYEAAGLGEILARAGMGEAEFAARFAGKAALTLAVMEAFIGYFKARITKAYESELRWPDNLRAAAYEAARYLREEPEASYFGMVSAIGAGDLLRAHREATFVWCARMIDAGRELAPDPDAVAPMAAVIAIGAVAEMLRRQQEGAVVADPVAVVPEMMYGAVRPYLGEAAARRELGVPPPADLADLG
jgi:AcrR family transcriptional regulator